LRDGYGRYIWSDGSYYEGEWKNHFMDGNGKKVNQFGDYYEGEFLQNKFE